MARACERAPELVQPPADQEAPAVLLHHDARAQLAAAGFVCGPAVGGRQGKRGLEGRGTSRACTASARRPPTHLVCAYSRLTASSARSCSRCMAFAMLAALLEPPHWLAAAAFQRRAASVLVLLLLGGGGAPGRTNYMPAKALEKVLGPSAQAPQRRAGHGAAVEIMQWRGVCVGLWGWGCPAAIGHPLLAAVALTALIEHSTSAGELFGARARLAAAEAPTRCCVCSLLQLASCTVTGSSLIFQPACWQGARQACARVGGLPRAAQCGCPGVLACLMAVKRRSAVHGVSTWCARVELGGCFRPHRQPTLSSKPHPACLAVLALGHWSCWLVWRPARSQEARAGPRPRLHNARTTLPLRRESLARNPHKRSTQRSHRPVPLGLLGSVVVLSALAHSSAPTRLHSAPSQPARIRP